MNITFDFLSMFYAILFLLPVAWLSYLAISLTRNYELARQMKVPIVISPFNPVNPLWMISQKWLIPLLQRLPFGLGSFTRYNRMGWVYHDKYRLHAELGDVFVHVNPAKNQLFVANPEAVEEIFQRRKDFEKPIHMYKILEIFGRNANTVKGHDWQRHRKITAPPFNERNSSMVWTESLGQAREMLDWWTRRDSPHVKTTDKDTRILSLHVLASAGFGASYPFLSAMDPPGSSFTMNYRDALTLVLSNILMIVIIPPKILSLPFMPKKWARVGQAAIEFKRYMTQMLERERQSISQQAPERANLMSALVRGSEEARSAMPNQTPGHAPTGLTDSEILGNLFLYNFAGHETTGNILTYSILLLAAHPQWQDWIAEEIQHVFGDKRDGGAWDYELFPQLKRCLAIMLESLRLYSPVTAIPKYTETAQTLRIGATTHLIPADTLVLLNVFAMHTHPRYWGADSLAWRPSRWITSAPPSPFPSDASANHDIEGESLVEPAKGTYIPWSGGARVCVGKKFAQVEFVAVMVVLFRRYRVRAVRTGQETPGEAQRRVEGVVRDSLLKMTLQVREPERAEVEWV